MSFGQNLQFLRKMRNKMSQEELAEKLAVSRQAVSKWESDIVYPEIDKLIQLCELFSCTMDQLVREDMNPSDEAYSDVRTEEVEGFSCIRYAVISGDPETDAIAHVRGWAEELGIEEPEIIGGDFPVCSQEQINVYNMHGYEAALILRDEELIGKVKAEVYRQEKHKYVAVTIKEPSLAPFQLIPNAYKILMAYIEMNGIGHQCKDVIPCFEKEYVLDGMDYMDVYIAVE